MKKKEKKIEDDNIYDINKIEFEHNNIVKVINWMVVIHYSESSFIVINNVDSIDNS